MRVFSRPLWRNAWLLLAIGVFFTGTIVSGLRIYETQNVIFWNYRTGTWMVVEAQAEYGNALAAAKNFHIDPTEAALDDLTTRFDVFWSRIPLILESEEGASIRRIEAVAANTKKIADVLPLLDEDLASAVVGDGSSILPFERRISELGLLFEEMTRIILVQDELRYRAGSLMRDMQWTVIAFLVSLGAGIALIIANLLSTRRIHSLLKQREAVDRIRSAQLTAIESSGEGIVMFDRRGRLSYSNEAFQRLIGDDFTRTFNLESWRRFLTDESAMTMIQGLRRVKSGGPWRGEVTGLTIAGEERAWEAHVMQHGEGGFIAVIRDLTDRKAAEREREHLQQHLHQVEKMDAMGRLAGGVAHDFNNILAAILGFSSLLDFDLVDCPEQKAMAQQILAAAERGKELVKSIMSFSRAEKMERVGVDVANVCREAGKMVSLSIPGPAVFATAIGDGVMPVLGNASQISRAVINLCVNARDALEGNRGTVRLEVRRISGEGVISPASVGVAPAGAQPVVRIQSLSPVRTHAWIDSRAAASFCYVRIRVTDDGSGIERSTMEKMFDPFFTTKEAGKGTGLGLSSVLATVKSHGGIVSVDSTVGGGTTFDILLPINEAAMPAQAPVAAGSPAAVPAGLAVLLVDDDPSAGGALSAILEKVGCEVAYCGSGAEALEVMADEPEMFDFVITDLSMPSMSGLDLAGRLRERGFARPIVLASARLQDASPEDRAKVGISHVVAKPFTLGDISEVIHSIAGREAA